MRDGLIRCALQYAGVWPIRPPSSEAARRLLRSPAWYVHELTAPFREQGRQHPPALPLVPFHSRKGEQVRLTYPVGYSCGVISSPVMWRWGAEGHIRLVHHPRLEVSANYVGSDAGSAGGGGLDLLRMCSQKQASRGMKREKERGTHQPREPSERRRSRKVILPIGFAS